MPLEVGEADGMVGEALGIVGVGGAPPQEAPGSGLRSEKDPPRPPLGCAEPRETGL